MNQNGEILMHYGVPGMKWGHRKNVVSSTTSARKSTKNNTSNKTRSSGFLNKEAGAHLKKLSTGPIDAQKVKKVESIYGELPDSIRRTVSNISTKFVGDTCRFVSYNEIAKPFKEFKNNKIVPLIDIYDNDFIGYNTKSKKMTRYNLSDNIEW